VPPLSGVAVNVTGVPELEHIAVEVEVILTEGVTVGVIVTVTGFLSKQPVAVVPLM
jgi:hypothetical protein